MGTRPPPDRRSYQQDEPPPEQRRYPPRQPERAREPYPPPRPRFSLEDVAESVAALQETVDRLTSSQLTRDHITSVLHEFEVVIQQQFTRYYSAEIVEAKLTERAQVLHAMQERIDTLAAKIDAERQATQRDVAVLKAGGWRAWERRLVVASAIFVGGVFAFALLVDLLKAVIH